MTSSSILWDPLLSEPYLLLSSPRFPSGSSIRITPARSTDGPRLAHIYNVPEIGLRMFKTPYPFLPSDAQSYLSLWTSNHAPIFQTIQTRLSSKPSSTSGLTENIFRTIRLIPSSSSTASTEGLLIGTCSLSPSFDKTTQSDRLNAKEIGFALLEEYSGRGIAGAVAEALMRMWEEWEGGEEERRLRTWVAFVETNNAGSLKLLERLGFKSVFINPAGPWPECKGGGTRESSRLERGRLDGKTW